MVLQQSTTIRPFMRHLIPFATIAGRASCNDIGDIISAPSGKRNDVLSVPYKTLFSMPLTTIIAMVVLAFQLLKELVSSKRVAPIVTSKPSLMVNRLSNSLPTFTLPICLSNMFPVLGMIILRFIRKSLFTVLMVILPSKRPVLFSMALIILSIIFSSFFFVFLFPLRKLPASLFLVCLVIGFVLLACACSAYTSQLISIFAESGKGKKLLTYTALFALRGIRGYTVIHVKGHSLASRLGMLTTSLRQYHFPPLYHTSALQATSHLYLCSTNTPLEV